MRLEAERQDAEFPPRATEQHLVRSLFLAQMAEDMRAPATRAELEELTLISGPDEAFDSARSRQFLELWANGQTVAGPVGKDEFAAN